jgi:exopolysaccharide biosynthesis polyprenyl glycosylphosphotransferase
VSGVASAVVLRLLDGPGWLRLRLLVDILMLYLASAAALFAAHRAWTPADRWVAATYPLLVLALIYARRKPEQRINVPLLDIGAHVLGVVSLAAMLTIAADSILGAKQPLGLGLRLWLFSVVYLGVARMTLLSVRRQARQSGALATPTLILGAGIVGQHLARRLAGDPTFGLRPIGFLDADPLAPGRRRALRCPVLGSPDDLEEVVERTGTRHVILAFSSDPDRSLVAIARRCQALGVEVSLVPRLYESINDRAMLDHVGGLPLLALRPVNPRGWQFAVKHSIDRAAALLAIVAIAPLMLVIALAVRLSSPGPVLFRQRRVGRDGHVFDVLKFRTMREPSEATEMFEPPEGVAPGGVEGEDRTTAVGRLLRRSSLDELPQFLNVLRGEMSIVGPRPERTEFVARFARDVDRYTDRHRVKSGITGWAQVNGLRGQTSIADRVEWDNYYIQNWSLRLDLRILALTVAEVLKFRDSQKIRKYGHRTLGRRSRTSSH